MVKRKSSFKGMIWLSLLCMVMTLALPVQLVFYPKPAYAATTPNSENFNTIPTDSATTSPRIIGDWTFSMVSTAGGTPRTQIKQVSPNTTNDLLFTGTVGAAANEYACVQSNTGGAFKLLSFQVIERNGTADQYKVVGYLGGKPVAGAEKSFNPISGSFFSVDVSSDSAWQNIDEFRIYAKTTIKLEIDDLIVTDPNAAMPSIGTQPADKTVNVEDSTSLSVAASVSDGGTLSYQWYSNNTNSNSGGTAITGATNATYAPLTGTAGTTYYYVVVTNTNNSVAGTKTATVTSSVAKVTVNSNTATYTVTYNGNGSTGGSVPTDVGSYASGDTVTVKGNTESLVKSGYTFAGWNTASNGSGTSYALGDTFLIGSTNVTLYAKWTTNQPLVSVTVGSSSGAKGTIVEIPISIDTPSLGIDNYLFTLDYDIAKLQFIEAVDKRNSKNFWGEDESLGIFDNYTTPITTAGELFVVKFKVLSDEEVIPVNIDVSNSVIKDANQIPFTTTFTNGKVTPTHTVAFNSNGGSTVTSQTVAHGNQASKPTDPTKAGNTFGGWYSDAGLTNAFNFSTTITGDTTLYGKWTANSYTVTFNSNGGSAVTNQTVVHGGTASEPTAPTKVGYTFGGWYSDAGLTNAFNFSTTITGDTTLYAKWTSNNYTVTFNSNGGSTVTSQTVAHGNQASKPTDPTKAGNTFGGWYSDAGLTNAFNFSTTITEDTTLYAKWTANDYTVTFSSNGGSTVTSQTVAHGNQASEPSAPTKAGNTFGGWYSDAGLTNAFSFSTTITGDTTLYAKWTANDYTVTFSSNGGSTVTSQTVAHGNQASKPTDPTKAGNTFGGWYSDAGLTNAFNFSTTITGDTTLYAKWTSNDYTVTFNSNGGSAVTSQTVAHGNQASKPTDPTKAGNTFGGWYSDAGLTNAFNFSTTITGDTTLYAKWTSNDYTVTFNSNGGSAVTSQTVAHGNQASKPTDPTKAGNTFGGWYSDAGLTNAFNFSTTITGDTTLYAKWTANSYTVTFNSNGGSAVTNQTVVHEGTASEPTAPTKTGYTFGGWYSDAGLTNAFNFSTTITEDTTLYGKWTANSYTVMFNSNGGSAVTSQTVAHGNQASKPTDPTKAGYTFGGWYSDAGLTNAFSFSTTITGDTTLYAKWTSNDYTVTFNSNGGSTVANQTVAHGGTASEPTAPTKAGNTFGGWYSDAGLTNAFAFTTVITENTTLYAKWTTSITAVTSIVLDKPSLNLKVGGATGTLMATVLPADATNKQVTWSSSNESVATVDANGVVTPKAAGTTTITVKTVDGNKTATCLVTVQPASSGGSGGSSTPAQPSTPSTPSAPTTGVEVLVNGKVENAGIATASKVNDQTVTTIAVDPKKLDAKLEAEGQHAVITIPVKTNSDILVGELTGQMVKNMEQKQAVVEIKTEKASYTLPAQQINIDAVSEQIGKSVNLQDIKVKIEISKPTAETAKIVENSAAKGEFTIVAPPVNFTVKGTYGDKTINVSKFNAYVERTIAIPDGIDPNKITTGVVVDPDGTARHVPTKIVVIDGKYFAKINSLTNSTYSVVWHPLEFKDVEKHWAKNAVNDMGSRMVISGVGHDLFNPDQDITRAEFAAIMVRGLGIKQEDGVAPFADVKAADWYSGAVQTAYKYNLIRGFTDGTFRPNDKITREQAMAIIAKAMKITDLQAKLQPKEAGELLLPFIDAKQASEWAKEGVADCVQSGLVSGRNGQQLAPKEFISRAEVAAIVQRLLQKSELI